MNYYCSNCMNENRQDGPWGPPPSGPWGPPPSGPWGPPPNGPWDGQSNGPWGPQTPQIPTPPEETPEPTSEPFYHLCDCFNGWVYIWLRNGRHFWTYLDCVCRHYIICWRWSRRNRRWNRRRININDISRWACVRFRT